METWGLSIARRCGSGQQRSQRGGPGPLNTTCRLPFAADWPLRGLPRFQRPNCGCEVARLRWPKLLPSFSHTLEGRPL